MQKNYNKQIVAKREKQNNTSSISKLYVATFVTKVEGEKSWLIDIGAIKHMGHLIPNVLSHIQIVHLGDNNSSNEIVGKVIVSIALMEK